MRVGTKQGEDNKTNIYNRIKKLKFTWFNKIKVDHGDAQQNPVNDGEFVGSNFFFIFNFVTQMKTVQGVKY